jgi:solute carrier family 50 protein (sugar transporter)
MTSVKDVFMNTVAPIIGTTLSSLMYISPIAGSYRVHKSQNLGDFNPIPYPLMIFNNLVWATYALGLNAPSQYYVLTPNWFGFMSGVLILGWTFPLASRKTQYQMMSIFMFIVVVYLPAVYGLLLACSLSMRQYVVGKITLVVQFVFFGSPLMNILSMVKNKDASSIYFPLALMTSVSCSAWAVYGLAISDQTVLLPNLVGGIIGYLQILLRCIFPGKTGGRIVVDALEEEDEELLKDESAGGNSNQEHSRSKKVFH